MFPYVYLGANHQYNAPVVLHQFYGYTGILITRGNSTFA